MNENVLVLNANFEPINVCDMRRAIGLILADRAAMVVDGRGAIKTINRTFPRPSIIRLQKMVHKPRNRVRLTRREVFRRDNFTCLYCGKRSLDLTIDHVIPRQMGGRHLWNNVVTACASCNHRKGGRKPEEAGMTLLHAPAEPPSSAIYVFGKHLNENAEWEPYLHGW